MSKFSIAIHGGAGTILRKNMSPEKELLYRKSLEEALGTGFKILSEKGSAIDAVKAAVMLLEDNSLFNAGRGSVFTHEGTHEMDAAIMDGKLLKAGAVAGVRTIRNPIELAHAVMEKSEHVFLSGEGAENFAELEGIKTEPEEYFFSQMRYDQLQKIKDSGESALDHDVDTDKKFGTVGAVALDLNGNLAAATSTGGMTNKKYGRIGDSPLIGSGTYANNKTCAISATGHGEAFIRAVAAYDVSCLMEYKGYTLEEAMEIVVNKKLPVLNGDGGMIGIDAYGNAALIFNSKGMYRGWKSSSGSSYIAIYR